MKDIKWYTKNKKKELESLKQAATKRLIQGLEDLEIRGPVDTIQTTPMFRSARILRIVKET